MKPTLFYFYFLLMTFGVFAQANQYKLNNFSTIDGLSQSSVIAIHQDAIGQMWFATRDGLNKYDGSKFYVFRNNPKDTCTISNNDILAIEEDHSKNLWVGTYNGLNCYNPIKNTFRQYFHDSKNNSLCNNTVWTIKEIKNEIWIGTSKGLSIYNKTTKKFITLFHNSRNQLSLPNNFILSIAATKKGDIWIGTAKGLCKLIRRKNGVFSFQDFNSPENGEALYVQTIKEDTAGNLWIGTKISGIYLYNKTNKKLLSLLAKAKKNGIDKDIRSIDIDHKGALWVGSYAGLSVIQPNGTIQKVFNNPDKKTSTGKIKSVFTDKKGSVWIGSYYNGINIWDVSNVNFTNLNQNSGKKALSFDVVSAIVADNNKNIYFGTEGGGITILDNKTRTTSYLNTSTAGAAAIDNIKSMFVSMNGIIWIGSLSEGLAAYDIKSKRFVNELIPAELRKLLNQSGVYTINKSDTNFLWIGTFGKGLIRYNTLNGTYKVIENNGFSNNSLTNDRVRTILVDKKNRIWIGTQSGLNRINLSNIDATKLVINHFFFDKKALSGDDILSLYQDRKNRIWVGTKAKGLYLFNGATFKKININSGNSLITSIHSISEDSKNDLWLSTNYGIVKYNPSRNSLIIYNQKNGLVSNEFNDNANLQLDSHHFYYGGPLGVTYFDSNKIAINTYSPQVILTDFKIKNESITPEIEDGILENNIAYTSSLKLSYDKANFTINFSTPNFINPSTNQYSYRLVGLDNNWTTTTNTEVSYVIQKPGTYHFEVKGANNDGIWNKTPTTLEIIVKPAPWRSAWAFLLYFILLGLAFYALIWIIKTKENLKRELELEQVESEINKGNTLAKLEFFTNISHEFRTPLTLILGPLQQILSNYNGTNEMYKKLLVIENSANHLLSLINRLMDFRKFENNKFVLESAEGNIVKFLQEIFLSFTEYAKVGGYTFTFNASDDEINVYYDRNKLERVFYNLISNAFRYTPKGGFISINIKKEAKQILIEVEDSGIGIAAENLNNIFELFFEIPAHKNSEVDYNKGSGVGLSIAKNIVLLHKGTIDVANKNDGGVVFTVSLPLGREHLSSEEIITDFKISDDVSQYISQLDVVETIEEDLNDLIFQEDKYTILLVEDHKVLRSFMKNLLKKDYNIIEAENGKKGLKKALEHIPDLIVSDVVMPEMVGTELCAKIKENIKTSHIPVILLTSRTSLIYKIEGLENGADDYISKPFNLNEFKLRIKNLLDSTQRLKAKFSSQDAFSPEDLSFSSLDEQLLKKAFKVVEENIANEQFDIPFFSAELGVSRTMLFTKIKAWTNLTPNDFIQEIRMKRAAQLLEQNKMNISQISYKVGFNNPKYFSKCFQKKYGETPSQYANKFSGDSTD